MLTILMGNAASQGVMTNNKYFDLSLSAFIHIARFYSHAH